MEFLIQHAKQRCAAEAQLQWVCGGVLRKDPPAVVVIPAEHRTNSSALSPRIPSVSFCSVSLSRDCRVDSNHRKRCVLTGSMKGA